MKCITVHKIIEPTLVPARVSMIDQGMGEKRSGGLSESRNLLEDPPEDDVENDASRNAHPGDLQYSNSIALLCHTSKASSAAFEVGRKGGEYVTLTRANLLVKYPNGPDIANSNAVDTPQEAKRTLGGFCGKQSMERDIPCGRVYPDPAHCRGCQSSRSGGPRLLKRGS